MNKKKSTRIEAVVLTALLLGTMFLVPASSIGTFEEKISIVEKYKISPETIYSENKDLGPFKLDRIYHILDPTLILTDDEDNDDAGAKRDAGDSMRRATIIYPGEPVDNTPGRGKTAKISSAGDEDWYRFSVGEGQEICITMNPPSGNDYDLSLFDVNDDEVARATSKNSGSGGESITYIADYTGSWYMFVEYVDGPSDGQYSFDITLSQNDAGCGSDTGDTMDSATPLTPGEYSGYLDMNDEQDWYKFNANAGDGIHFYLNMSNIAIYSDFDITLYNPSGELVHEEDYYYDDELFYPADESGEWSVKVDIFPGYANAPQPTEWKYYYYGSGAYELKFNIESSAPDPIAPIPQPQITPIAKTFKITNDPNSNKDEYGYLASIPACNYLENGDRYLAPIVYEGDDTPTNYYETDADRGVVDDTTQYLLDDWNVYLASHGKTASEYAVDSDPIKAAADIATTNWDSSDVAVVAVEGSGFEDTVETVLQETKTLKRVVEVEEISSDDPMFEGSFQYTTFLGKEWGAIDVSIFDITGWHRNDDANFLTNVFPNYINFGGDWWPVPYDGNGDGTDIYYPVTQIGIWSTGSHIKTEDWSHMRVRKYAGDRYNIKVNNPDSVLSVKVETTDPSDLLVFLVDPDGYLREPDMPRWNGPVNPIHVWNGFENPEVNPWREWNPDPHTEFSAEIIHPEKGSWTAIVVPRDADGPDLEYTVTGELKTINPKRADATISAANAAVIASLEHAPLLYVTEDSVPSETSNALSQLGVSKVIFVERGNIGAGVKSEIPNLETDLTTMQNIIDFIKDYDSSENYITITSIKSGNGYFAPATMLAAYHGSPVLRIGEAPGNPAGMADRIETWRLWSGDFYHGSRSTGHLPDHTEPLSGEGSWDIKTLFNAFIYAISGGKNGGLPPLGMDAKRYWNGEMYKGFHDWIVNLGLDNNGQEAYCFVAPRDDIYLTMHAVMMGNNSYAGHIPGITTAYISAVAVRNVMYSAVIFGNPNRDVTTSQLMNFADGGFWTTNDGESHNAYSSREIKKIFGSHFRTYEGHCLWDAHLERMNDGASALYYAGHGTGGSGTSAQYYQTEHCDYPEQIWWDAWRGYAGFDNWKIVRNNGRSWYNAEPPSLYDIVHYDYADELFENLGSNAILYLSCTTSDGFGPMVYLDHGAVLFFGNAGSGLTPQEDLMDNEVFEAAMLYGEPLGQAFSQEVWRHLRDFTTDDPTAMYGSSSLSCTTVQCLFGDPSLVIYSPEWISPVPVDA